MSTMVDINQQREDLVRKHMDAENRRDIETVLDTFSSPKYEIIPTGEVHEGRKSVSKMFENLFGGFPDLQLVPKKFHHADTGLIVEFDMKGTHEGIWAGIEPSSNRISVPCIAVYEFEGEQLVCERVYFDFATLQAQVSR